MFTVYQEENLFGGELQFKDFAASVAGAFLIVSLSASSFLLAC